MLNTVLRKIARLVCLLAHVLFVPSQQAADLLLAGSNYIGLYMHTEHQVSRECLHLFSCPLCCLPGLKLHDLAPHELRDALANCWTGLAVCTRTRPLLVRHGTNRLWCS